MRQSLNNLAGLLADTGRHDEAEPLFREALEVTRAALGEAHADYANRLNNLAGLLDTTGRHDEAEPLYREALDVTRAALGEGACGLCDAPQQSRGVAQYHRPP